jgi:hypothetical protein
MVQIRKFTKRLRLPTGQAAHHCQASSAAPQRCLRGVWLATCERAAGHRRIEREGPSRCLRQYGSPGYPNPAPYIRILIASDARSGPALFIDLLSGDLQGCKLATATDTDRLVPGVGFAQDDTPDSAAHRWLKRDILTRTQVGVPSAECPQRWNSREHPLKSR